MSVRKYGISRESRAAAFLELELRDSSLDAIQPIKEEHRCTYGHLIISGLSDNERSESVVDRSSENS